MTYLKKLFSKFPKKRITLDKRYQSIHEKQYIENRKNTTTAAKLSNFLESWLHIFVSNTKKNIDVDEDILELGAGTLNHLPYEKKFKVYDIVEPFYDLYKNSRYKTKISNFYDDISDIKGEKKYDRIISIAVLEHILDLPKVMATSSVLLKKDGIFSAGIPSEGSPIWYLGWRLSTGLEFFFRYKLNYGKILIIY